MSCDGVTAAEIVNETPEKELADLIYKYGEERKSRQIAAKIAAYRKNKEISTTKELAEIIYTVIHKTPNGIDPATRTFQALRIAVNNELGELENGLRGAVDLAVSGGRIVVVSFHSLEDRIVKTFLRKTPAKMFTFHAICRTTIFNKTTAFWPPAPKRLPLLRTRRRLTAAPGRPNCAMLSKGNVTRKELHHE